VDEVAFCEPHTYNNPASGRVLCAEYHRRYHCRSTVHFAIGGDRQCFQSIVAAPIALETNYIRLNLIRLPAGLAMKGQRDLGSLAMGP
jgi:hypothetical protein